jgi:TRAP-type C4-dicarboxylate transport system permease small subunit
VLAAYSAALDRIDRVARLAIIAIVAVMIAIVSLQVVLRYVFNTSIDWSDEVSRLLFVWSMFLAIPLGIREGSHVGVELLVGRFPPEVRRQLVKAMSLVAIVLMAVVFWQSVVITVDTWDELLPTLNLSANWFMVPVPISALHCILHLVQLFWREPVRTIVTME